MLWRRCLEIIGVVVIVQIQLFVESPINKLNEQDLTLAILISLLPLLVHVAGVDAPLGQEWFRLQKLLFVDTLVLTVVDFVESDEEFEVLAQELEQISELLTLGNVVVAV